MVARSRARSAVATKRCATRNNNCSSAATANYPEAPRPIWRRGGGGPRHAGKLTKRQRNARPPPEAVLFFGRALNLRFLRLLWFRLGRLVIATLARSAVSNFPQPAVPPPLPTRETLVQRHARWPCRIPLRGGAQGDRADVATGNLHTSVRTQQHRRGYVQ